MWEAQRKHAVPMFERVVQAGRDIRAMRARENDEGHGNRDARDMGVQKRASGRGRPSGRPSASIPINLENGGHDAPMQALSLFSSQAGSSVLTATAGQRCHGYSMLHGEGSKAVDRSLDEAWKMTSQHSPGIFNFLSL
jgi:hypothetical protein